MDAALRSLLLERPGVTNQVAQRIYPAVMPDDVDFPAVVYELISDTAEYSNDNAWNGGETARRLRFQFDSYAETLEEARRVDDAIRAVLSGFRGNAGGCRLTVFRSNSFQSWFQDEEFWRVATDYIVHVAG